VNEEGCYYEMGSAVAPPSLREHCSITSFVLFICSEANGITYLPFWVTLNRPRPARARRLDTSETILNRVLVVVITVTRVTAVPAADSGFRGRWQFVEFCLKPLR